jgi:5-formyltetrahydrofolate cyclo-ligase
MSETKAELRSRLRATRKRLQAALPDAGRDLAAGVGALLDSLDVEPKTAALYLPLGSEIDTGPLADELRRRGLALCLPRVDAPDRPMSFRAWSPGDPVAPDLQTCLAPPASAPEIAPELIFVPLVAFDAGGGRLGQGGGYYDRTLAALADKRPVVIGLAFAGQQVERVPCDPHDQKLDGILTERGYMPARKGS